jgi:hypothetical protein
MANMEAVQFNLDRKGTYAEGTNSPSEIVEKVCTLINRPSSLQP